MRAVTGDGELGGMQTTQLVNAGTTRPTRELPLVVFFSFHPPRTPSAFFSVISMAKYRDDEHEQALHATCDMRHSTHETQHNRSSSHLNAPREQDLHHFPTSIPFSEHAGPSCFVATTSIIFKRTHTSEASVAIHVSRLT